MDQAHPSDQGSVHLGEHTNNPTGCIYDQICKTLLTEKYQRRPLEHWKPKGRGQQTDELSSHQLEVQGKGSKQVLGEQQMGHVQQNLLQEHSLGLS